MASFADDNIKLSLVLNGRWGRGVEEETSCNTSLIKLTPLRTAAVELGKKSEIFIILSSVPVFANFG